MLKKFIIVLALISILVIPVVVLADDYGLTAAAPKDLTTSKLGNDIPTIVGSVVGVGLSLLGVIFFLLILYAGILWMTALGNEKKADTAKSIMEAAGIGLMIVLAAYAITTFLFKNVGNGGMGSTGNAGGAGANGGCCMYSKITNQYSCSQSMDQTSCEAAAKDPNSDAQQYVNDCSACSGAGTPDSNAGNTPPPVTPDDSACAKAGGSCASGISCQPDETQLTDSCSNSSDLCCKKIPVVANCEETPGNACYVGSCSSFSYLPGNGTCLVSAPNCCKSPPECGSIDGQLCVTDEASCTSDPINGSVVGGFLCSPASDKCCKTR